MTLIFFDICFVNGVMFANKIIHFALFVVAISSSLFYLLVLFVFFLRFNQFFDVYFSKWNWNRRQNCKFFLYNLYVHTYVIFNTYYFLFSSIFIQVIRLMFGVRISFSSYFSSFSFFVSTQKFLVRITINY